MGQTEGSRTGLEKNFRKLNGGKQAHSSILFAAAPSIGVDMDIEMDGV